MLTDPSRNPIFIRFKTALFVSRTSEFPLETLSRPVTAELAFSAISVIAAEDEFNFSVVSSSKFCCLVAILFLHV